MKKKMLAAILMGTMVFGLTACGNESTEDKNGTNKEASSGTDEKSAEAPKGEISVISREDGSGTRGAFIELFGIEEKDASGEKIDNTTEDAQVTNNTSVMMTSVAGNPQAIGYISLGSLDESVKALKVDGAEATAENVKSDTYKIARPFNIATTEDVSEAAQDFISYILSQEGQKIVEDSGYIAIADDAAAYAGTKPSGKIVVAGSSSITPVMEKLKEGYETVNPNVEIEIQQSDSTTGMESAVNGICDIGMASRELKDSEIEAGLKGQEIALDGIAVIVNNENSMTDITTDQVKDIYTGEITEWSDLQ
ncbi:MAG: substrate-binding domain-containing protein [Bacillota bacterium]|nr:substrate-binding domain-containing protein [Bacillota bacterium]